MRKWKLENNRSLSEQTKQSLNFFAKPSEKLRREIIKFSYFC